MTFYDVFLTLEFSVVCLYLMKRIPVGDFINIKVSCEEARGHRGEEEQLAEVNMRRKP